MKFLTTFDDFAGDPLPAASVAEYRTYLSRSMPFVRARNQRIHGYAASELHDRTCTWRPVNCQSAPAFRSCCTAHISAPRLSAAYDSPAMASPRPGLEHEVTAGTPGNVAIPLCSASFWPPGGCQDRPGSSPHPARRTIRRQGLLIAKDQGDAARPRGPAVIPQPSDRIAHRKRRGSAGGRPPRFDSLAYKGRNVIERSFNDDKQW